MSFPTAAGCKGWGLKGPLRSPTPHFPPHPKHLVSNPGARFAACSLATRGCGCSILHGSRIGSRDDLASFPFRPSNAKEATGSFPRFLPWKLEEDPLFPRGTTRPSKMMKRLSPAPRPAIPVSQSSDLFPLKLLLVVGPESRHTGAREGGTDCSGILRLSSKSRVCKEWESALVAPLSSGCDSFLLQSVWKYFSIGNVEDAALTPPAHLRMS